MVTRKKLVDLKKLHEEMIMSSDELSCNPLLVVVTNYEPICFKKVQILILAWFHKIFRTVLSFS